MMGYCLIRNRSVPAKKSLQYLLGQLKPVHEEQHILTLEDMTKTYQGAIWAKTGHL